MDDAFIGQFTKDSKNQTVLLVVEVVVEGLAGQTGGGGDVLHVDAVQGVVLQQVDQGLFDEYLGVFAHHRQPPLLIRSFRSRLYAGGRDKRQNIQVCLHYMTSCY